MTCHDLKRIPPFNYVRTVPGFPVQSRQLILFFQLSLSDFGFRASDFRAKPGVLALFFQLHSEPQSHR